ncbi:MAG: radical SAM protein [Candidatus Eremiobacteraeota bacterium]|nr:radical SAM protein [Candidatus Eremiobacteraeota bacterium]
MKISGAKEILRSCRLCPRRCGKNRLSGERGFCRQSEKAAVAAIVAHRGEEPPLSGSGGAGTVFLGGCTMACIFCQNYQISHYGGTCHEMPPRDLAAGFLDLEGQGCHCIEWVSPTPHIPALIEALAEARGMGLSLPVVYNTNGYLSAESLELLEGIVDVYLPDMKYACGLQAQELSGTADYIFHNRLAVTAMYRQRGPLVSTARGTAARGLLVRILLLPSRLEGAEETLAWIRDELGTEVPLSLMSQYLPLFKARGNPLMGKPLERRRKGEIIKKALSMGFSNLYVQGRNTGRLFIPDFTKTNPFESEEEREAAGSPLSPDRA